MARFNDIKEIVVPEKRGFIDIETIKCDKCGRVIDRDEPPDDNEDLYAQELIILLNVSLCINSRIRFDFCRRCLEPIWNQICDALGIDPRDEHRIGQDED